MLLIHPIRIGNITSISTCYLRDMNNRIMAYFCEETRSWRDIHINIDASIPTVSAHICGQFLIHTDILLIHPIRIGNITSISTRYPRDMDNKTTTYYLQQTRSQRDIEIGNDAPIPTVSAHICGQFQYIRNAS